MKTEEIKEPIIPSEILNELKNFKFCPFCDAKHKHLNVKREHRRYIAISKNKIVEGWQYFYECSKCQKQFTTTLSDDLSFKNFKTKTK